MSVGKRRSTDEPLTEHDVAERLDKAAVRLYRILTEVREMDMLEAVQHSRYYHGEMLAALAAELADGWQIVPQPLRLSPWSLGRKSPAGRFLPDRRPSMADQAVELAAERTLTQELQQRTDTVVETARGARQAWLNADAGTWDGPVLLASWVLAALTGTETQ